MKVGLSVYHDTHGATSQVASVPAPLDCAECFCAPECAGRRQSTAKELYLVTDGDLKKLGCLTRANPQHKDWAPLKLYMQSQARACADTPPASSAGLQTLFRLLSTLLPSASEPGERGRL